MKLAQTCLSQGKSYWVKNSLILLSFLAYFIVFWHFYPQTGLAIAAISVIPVMLLGWAYGMRVGMLAGMLIVPVDSLNLYLMQAPNWSDLSSRSFAGYLAVILAGAVVGRLHDLSLRLAQELQQRQAVEDALQQREARLNLLHQIDKAILRAEKSELIADFVLNTLLKLIKADSASIHLYDLQLETFLILSTSSEDKEMLTGTIQRIEDAVSLQHLQDKQVYLIPDLGTKADLSHADRLLLKAGIQSIVRIPLISQNRLLGSINFHAQTAHAFQASDFEIAVEVADQLAIALENNRLLERERENNTTLAVLQQASLELSSSLNVVTILDVIVDYCVLLLMAKSAHLFLYHKQELSFGAAYWDGKKQVKASIEIQPDDIEYEIAHSGQVCRILDPSQDARIAKYGKQGSFLGLALKAGGEIKGIICIHLEESRQLESYELHAIELLADQAAVALQNAELYGKMQDYTEDLERRVLDRTQTLAKEKERIETILFSSSDAILLLDEQGLIQQANPSFYEQFGDHLNVGATYHIKPVSWFRK